MQKPITAIISQHAVRGMCLENIKHSFVIILYLSSLTGDAGDIKFYNLINKIVAQLTLLHTEWNLFQIEKYFFEGEL